MVTFSLVRCRFAFEAIEAVHFPKGKAANVLRGAFGTVGTTIEPATYLRFFEPSAVGAPSGLATPPRPFVLRAAHLDGQTFQPGEPFHFHLHIFDTRHPGIEELTAIFRSFSEAGLGANRRRAILTGVEPTGLAFSLEPPAQLVTRVRVEFVTPTELKAAQEIAALPEFGILFARVRDRISTLRDLYADGALPIDFREMGERAAHVQLVQYSHEYKNVTRRSSRTGQTHSIGGFVGTAEYEGELAPFLPYLELAAWTGVGRQTVWGKGELRVQVLN